MPGLNQFEPRFDLANVKHHRVHFLGHVALSDDGAELLSTLAQIGAPESDFANESLVRLHGVDDEIGLPAGDRSACPSLIAKGRLTEAEALAMIGGDHVATDLNS